MQLHIIAVCEVVLGSETVGRIKKSARTKKMINTEAGHSQLESRRRKVDIPMMITSG